MRILLLFLLGLTAALSAADAIQEFNRAMAGNDAQAKKQAIAKLQAAGLEDDQVLPLLIRAVGDRQAGRYAVPALRSRTGLAPAASRENNSGYPGYPTSDSAAGWSQWLSARKKAQEEEAKLQSALETAEEAKEEAKEAKAAVAAVDLDGDGEISDAETAACTAADADEDGTLNEDELAAASAALAAATSGDPEAELPDHLKPETQSRYGKLDRLFFTDGSILRCYIMTKRTDLKGQLTSVRIIHKDGGGEEIIDASVVARIEEDIE